MYGSSVALSALCGKRTLSMTDRTDSNVLEQRLSAIVDALEAENVAADENELWFEPKLGGGLQIRLGRELHARCYDRSANFAISYGGHPATEPMSPAFRDALQRIKAIDHSPIDGAASAVPSAARARHRRAVPGSAPDLEDGHQVRLGPAGRLLLQLSLRERESGRGTGARRAHQQPVALQSDDERRSRADRDRRRRRAHLVARIHAIRLPPGEQVIRRASREVRAGCR